MTTPLKKDVALKRHHMNNHHALVYQVNILHDANVTTKQVEN